MAEIEKYRVLERQKPAGAAPETPSERRGHRHEVQFDGDHDKSMEDLQEGSGHIR